jgi:hypothetical protein
LEDTLRYDERFERHRKWRYSWQKHARPWILLSQFSDLSARISLRFAVVRLATFPRKKVYPDAASY